MAVSAESAESAERAEAALQAAMLGLADEWSGTAITDQVTGSEYAADLRAALSDTTALDKALAEHGAKVLREAADELEGRLGTEGAPKTLWDFRAWLRARADRLAGESDE